MATTHPKADAQYSIFIMNLLLFLYSVTQMGNFCGFLSLFYPNLKFPNSLRTADLVSVMSAVAWEKMTTMNF